MSPGANLRRTEQNFSLDFSSNVADALAARLKEYAPGKFREAENETRNRINEKVGEDRPAFSEDLTKTAQLLESAAGDLKGQIAGVESTIEEKRSALEKKAEAEVKEKAKEEAEKRLKGLF